MQNSRIAEQARLALATSIAAAMIEARGASSARQSGSDS
jgi:hypothetical protein